MNSTPWRAILLACVASAVAAILPIAAQSHAIAPNAVPTILEFRNFRDVQSARNPHARFQVTAVADGKLAVTYNFVDTSNHAQFRDAARIDADALSLDREGHISHVRGTRRYVWSSVFAHATQPPGPRYFTPTQIGRANQLSAECKEYDTLIAESSLIVSATEIEPNATAEFVSSGATPQPSVRLTLDAAGTKKLGAFTTEHTLEIIGIITDGRVLSAPTLMEPITSGQFDISGFRSMADAQHLADEINRRRVAR